MKPQVRCPNCGKVLEAPEAPAPAIPTRRAMLTPEGRFLGEYDAARQVVILRYRGQDYEFPLLECDKWQGGLARRCKKL